jgi:hypothetical protein
MSSRELAKYVNSRYGGIGSGPSSDHIKNSAESVMKTLERGSSWQGIKAAGERMQVEKDPRYIKAAAQTQEAKGLADAARARVDQSRSAVESLARRAEEIGRETAEIQKRTEDARMHTESRMNMARKKYGKRAVAKVERKFAQGDRSLANVARQMGVFRAGR